MRQTKASFCSHLARATRRRGKEGRKEHEEEGEEGEEVGKDQTKVCFHLEIMDILDS